jgi:Mrp family chromosome partitioning ATPase/capsular polysaccharide biosynthesis protein
VKRYLELFFRHRILFALPMVVALLAGVAYASKAPRSYTSTATLFCDASLPNASTLQQAVTPGSVTPSADKMSTLQEFLRTQGFLNKVAQRIPLAPTHSPAADELAADVMGKTVTMSTPGPQILGISVKAASPELAAGTVKAVIDEFTAELGTVLKARGASLAVAYKTELDQTNAALASAQNALATYLATHPPSATDPQETQLASEVALAQQQHAQAQDRYNQAQIGIAGAVDPTAFHIIDQPKLPTAPASRKKQLLMSGVGGLLGGIVITILALVLLTAQDRSVREEDDVEATLDLEVVGTVPQFDKSVLSPSGRRRQREARGWFWTPPGLVESCTVALRHLDRQQPPPASFPRTGLSKVTRHAAVAERSPVPGGARNIGVTSCLRGEGRTTIARGMAAAAHQAFGLRTILVEFDFELPTLARELGIDPGPGVAEILRDGASIGEVLHMPADGSLGALLAGDTGGDPSGLLSSLRTSSLVRDVGALCDIVIADLPPLSPVGQAAALAPQFSTVLLVVRSGTAPVRQIRRALDDLDEPPPVILNGVESSIPRPLRALLAG